MPVVFLKGLAYIAWALFGLKISSENYENLSNNLAKQLKEFLVRSKSKEDLKIERILDEIIKSYDKLFDHFDLGKIKFLTDINTHPWVAVNSYHYEIRRPIEEWSKTW